MTETQFKALVNESLVVLESYNRDKNGNPKLEIFGHEKLYTSLKIKLIEELKALLEWKEYNGKWENHETQLTQFLKTRKL